jgi:hypothetical protein
MKLILCTLAVFLVAGALLAHPADAACWWNGWAWRCGPGWHPYWWHAHWGYWHPYWHGGYWHHWHHW